MIYYIYNEVDDLIGLYYSGNIYYYLKNAQNDIIGILDCNYNIIAKYKYDAWGNILSITDNFGNLITSSSHIAIINPFRYRSYYYDSETNLYYLNTRYYNPMWGRFLNADGIIGANDDVLSYNLYAYCSNNPIRKFDLDGNLIAEVGISSLLASVNPVAAALLLVAVGYGISKTKPISISKPMIKSKTTTSSKSKSAKKKNSGSYNVYKLVNKKTKKVEYIGRTKKLESARSRHHNNINRSYLDFVPIAEELSYLESRGLEQYYILKCYSLRRGELSYNQINGIDFRKRIFWDDAILAAKLAIDEHEIKVPECD